MLDIRNRFLCRKSPLYIGLAYTAFVGMWGFPLRFEKFDLLFFAIDQNVYAVGLISLFLFAYFNKKTIKLYFSILSLTGIGMLGRYFIEYGEVSNERNFTPFNIIIFLLVVPITITIISFLFNKIADSKEKSSTSK